MTKKRKRRSFWEPDSKEVVDWMNAQDNLGQSLQLIITDAIFNYGGGDAITSHIVKRFDDKIAPIKKSIKKDRSTRVRNETSPKTVVKDVPNSGGDTSPSMGENGSVDVVVEQLSTKNRTEEIDDDILLDVALAEIVDDKDEEYDPVEVMFGDLGARYDS